MFIFVLGILEFSKGNGHFSVTSTCIILQKFCLDLQSCVSKNNGTRELVWGLWAYGDFERVCFFCFPLFLNGTKYHEAPLLSKLSLRIFYWMFCFVIFFPRIQNRMLLFLFLIITHKMEFSDTSGTYTVIQFQSYSEGYMLVINTLNISVAWPERIYL